MITKILFINHKTCKELNTRWISKKVTNSAHNWVINTHAIIKLVKPNKRKAIITENNNLKGQIIIRIYKYEGCIKSYSKLHFTAHDSM